MGRDISDGLLGILLLALLSIYAASLSGVPKDIYNHFSFSNSDYRERNSMLFVGDVMLSRNVEKLMYERGTQYPFKGVEELFSSHDYVVGNLEGTVPEDHVKTETESLQFSIDEELLRSVKQAGFTTMTLANNHAYDFGNDAFLNTKKRLNSFGLFFAGHPKRTTRNDMHIAVLEGKAIALIPVNATDALFKIEEALETVASAEAISDYQVVYIHWGEEYDTNGNIAQTNLAHTLVENGADAIIGHHPHVVQRVDVYEGAPIFYSLGNFVFDQYWDEEVQTGLAVSLSIDGTELHYEVIPLRSSESVPRIPEEDEYEHILASLAEKSDPAIKESIESGRIVIQTDLASLRKTVMIDTQSDI